MGNVETHNLGVLTVLVTQFRRNRLPKLLEIKESVNSGKLLSEDDMRYLESMIADAVRAMPAVNGVPELHSFCNHVTHLIFMITEVALYNENNSLPPEQRVVPHERVVEKRKMKVNRPGILTPSYS